MAGLTGRSPRKPRGVGAPASRQAKSGGIGSVPCPNCDGNSYCVNTRRSGTATRRGRVCERCEARFTTYETATLSAETATIALKATVSALRDQADRLERLLGNGWGGLPEDNSA